MLPGADRMRRNERLRGPRPVTEYRCFQNDDVPKLKAFWRTLSDVPGLALDARIEAWEGTALAKPWFRQEELLLACEEDRIVGLVHFGFGPDAQGDDLDPQKGVLSQILVSPRPTPDERGAIAAELLRRCREALASQGAKEISALGARPNCPFYVGLYGGSRAVGLYASDSLRRGWLEETGFRLIEERIVMRRSLRTFSTVVNRLQIQIKREHDVTIDDPADADCWYTGCAEMPQQRRRFSICQRKTGEPRGSVDAWNPPPTVSTWAGPCYGLTNLRIEDGLLRKGLATHLLGETLARLKKEGAGEVEVQIDAADEALNGLFRKLEFLESDRKLLFAMNL
jgi:ribosomal protein S18 acetylase RimI-like enzyme